MHEVLTKNFWQGVKKTFYEALESPDPKDTAAPAPIANNSTATLPSDAPASSVTDEQK